METQGNETQRTDVAGRAADELALAEHMKPRAHAGARAMLAELGLLPPDGSGGTGEPDAGPQDDVGEDAADGGMDLQADGEDATDVSEGDGGGPSEGTGQEAARGERPSRIATRLSRIEEENRELRRQLAELSGRGTEPAPSDDELWDEFQVDRLGAIRKFVQRHAGDATEAEVQELIEEVVDHVTGIDKNPDIDPELASRRKMKRIEREALRRSRELDRRLAEDDKRRKEAAAAQARERTVQSVGSWFSRNAEQYPYLAAGLDDPAAAVAKELQLQIDEGGLVLRSVAHAEEVLREISAQYDTYHRERHRRVSERIGGKQAAAETKKKPVGKKKAQVTSREASETSAVKRGTASEPSDPAEWLRYHGIDL